MDLTCVSWTYIAKVSVIFTHMVSSLLIFILTAILVTESARWYPEGKYKCNCLDCPDCLRGCAKYWFGPDCQYYDVAAISQSSEPEVIDGNHSSCISKTKIESITLYWADYAFGFSWLRLRFKNSSMVKILEVNFRASDAITRNNLVPCKDKVVGRIDEDALDIYCTIAEKFVQLVLSGDGIQALCTVHVSGARNVAFNQKTNQRTTYSNYIPPRPKQQICEDATGNGNTTAPSCKVVTAAPVQLDQVNGSMISDNAVDGNTNRSLGSYSCSHSALTDNSPHFKVLFDKEYRIDRFTLYSLKGYENRMRGFQLKSFSSKNVTEVSYEDRSKHSKDIYHIPIEHSSSDWVKISSVEITWPSVLALCEIEVFGDSVCPTGTWGKDCEHKCNCKGMACHPAQGLCLTGCPTGFKGEGCAEECSPKNYGNICLKSCESGCFEGNCNNTNGNCFVCEFARLGIFCDIVYEPHPSEQERRSIECDHCISSKCRDIDHICKFGCQVGYIGPLCNRICPENRYGQSCKDICPTHCREGGCKSRLGTCRRGCKHGYKGLYCNESCGLDVYGEECNSKCSKNCRSDNLTIGQRICNVADGFCFNGCNKGFQGTRCDIPTFEKGFSLKKVLFAIPVVTVAILVVCIAVPMRLAKRRGSSDSNVLDTKSDPEGTDRASSLTEKQSVAT